MNHPGVMSRVCSLFARRAFNPDGVICLPVGNAATSRIRLLVADDHRLILQRNFGSAAQI
jgi:acetolactate synthase-1/3 small subunit